MYIRYIFQLLYVNSLNIHSFRLFCKSIHRLNGILFISKKNEDINSVNAMSIISTLCDVVNSWTMPNRRNNILPDFYRQYNNSTV